MFLFVLIYRYWLDTATEGSTAFVDLRALSCSNLSTARTLLRDQGFVNAGDPEGQGV